MIYTASVACASQLNIEKDVRPLFENGVTFMHVDLMDGHDVPNLSSNLDLMRELKEQFPEVVLDAHYMVTNPLDYIERSAKIGVDYFVTHSSNLNNIDEYIDLVKKNGMKVGLILKTEDDVDFVEKYLDRIDQVLVMAVKPGAYGQTFNTCVYDKVKKLRSIKEQRKLDYIVSVDGGVTNEIARKLKESGADAIVLGVFTVFKQADGIKEGLSRLNKALED